MSDYQTFFNISHDLFCVLDLNGYYKNVNPAFLRLLRYTDEELGAHPYTYFVHPEDLEKTVEEYEKAKEGGRNKVIENRFRSSDGAFHWIAWTTIVADENGNIYASGQNVSIHKQMEHARLKALEESNKMVTKAIIQTQESERSKISLELHDNVNQVLTTVKLLMELSQDEEQIARTNLQRAVSLQQEAINEIRNISRRLAAPALANLHLADSIPELLDQYPGNERLSFSLDMDEGLKGLDIDQHVHIALYRILQEQLTNIVKHSGARFVKISLHHEEGMLTMVISDDGVGFDPLKKSGGIGIQNMKARVEALKGSFSLVGERGTGTRLTAVLPLD